MTTAVAVERTYNGTTGTWELRVSPALYRWALAYLAEKWTEER